MNRSEFDDVVKEMFSVFHPKQVDGKPNRKIDYAIRNFGVEESDGYRLWHTGDRKGLGLEIEWLIGGVTGGDCYGGEANQPVDPDPEPEFESLDRLLERLCPNLSFLQYRKMMREVCDRTEKGGGHEYYGNRSIYAVKRVRFDALYNFLSREGLI